MTSLLSYVWLLTPVIAVALEFLTPWILKLLPPA